MGIVEVQNSACGVLGVYKFEAYVARPALLLRLSQAIIQEAGTSAGKEPQAFGGAEQRSPAPSHGLKNLSRRMPRCDDDVPGLEAEKDTNNPKRSAHSTFA